MPSFNNFIGSLRSDGASGVKRGCVAFIDVEVGADGKVHDYGAIKEPNIDHHGQSGQQFAQFIADAEYLCGHNIIHHDLKYLSGVEAIGSKKYIDTLYLSPLLFPRRPYHRLLKDDKLQTDEMNNPLNDCRKCQSLFYDEVNAFQALDSDTQAIFYGLLHGVAEFAGFFDYLGFQTSTNGLESLIHRYFEGRICSNSAVRSHIEQHPVELAYALALISTGDGASITPPWLVKNFAYIEIVLGELCNTPCRDDRCGYCHSTLDVHRGLANIFGFTEFRRFDGEPLQERSVRAAVAGESLLTIFPTGGGKSLTFQLPALMAGRAVHGLTVVISPLQSLMKDQVDNLAALGITEAVTINGLLDPVSRAEAFERVANGSASLLYIAPEMLRSKTLERLLLGRNVVRFVIDEAHCFSSWGHDFRVDYLYIGDFIAKLRERKQCQIAVSCFTATAKQKVVSDIVEYFKQKLNVELRIFASASARKNLHYSVIYAETEEDKYTKLRSLMLANNCPTIIYASRTRKTVDLAKKLSRDGLAALPFNGKMTANDKIANQNDFIANRVRAMVATSAFGMGVDKKDVGLVIHYDISDSLENYVQEAGRAGRDPSTEAKCYVLYSDHDLDKHFIMLNQTKLSISEIQQVWRAVKDFTKQRGHVCCSALEIARQAGWSDEVSDVETRVRTAISALEEAGYVSRGYNVPHVFATGIMVKTMDEANRRIAASPLFIDDGERQRAVRIIKSLMSSRSRAEAQETDAESRVDYLADMLGLTKESVIGTVNLLRQDGILADSNDMSAYIEHSENRSRQIFERFAKLERFMINTIAQTEAELSYKMLNEQAEASGLKTSIKTIKTLLYFLSVKSYIKKKDDAKSGLVRAVLRLTLEQTIEKYEHRIEVCQFVMDKLYNKAINKPQSAGETGSMVQFSITSLLKEYNDNQQNLLFQEKNSCSIDDLEDALLYLSTIGALKLEGGFMVIYNAMELHRLKEMKLRYKIEDYKELEEFYNHKRQQIHIVGEYANMMVRDYGAALQYVHDYFYLDYKKFISKYFKGERLAQIERNITPEKYAQLFGTLSEAQRKIIDDKQSKYIVVAAGPGSGKTRVLVHKLAALLLMEDVKHEQLLMLTFSRAAATEFKQRLLNLIGNAAHFVEIKTFHGFSFDLLGRVGNLDAAGDVVQRAAELIERGEAEQGRIGKTVLVIDEAQDMDEHEFALVRALMRNNEDMRVIAVGDDDQNIYQFRGADSRHMLALINEHGATKYELTANYRSQRTIVGFANWFIQRLGRRMKQQPGIAVQEAQGEVQIVRYQSQNLEIPLVRHLLSTYSNERACVLTNTNEEAARIAGLLTRNGVNARLIQSADGFRFAKLAEVCHFLRYIERSITSPIISDEQWEQAKQVVRGRYRASTCLSYMEEFWATFERVNRTKYYSDLQEFALESNLEDFCGDGQQTVFVSTIHKAKGREFDTVYMLLDGEQANTEERIRKLYVGITRAQRRLYIHCNTDVFAQARPDAVVQRSDSNIYPAPDEITLQLSHRDVWLDFFKTRKRAVLKCHSGMSLRFDNGYLLLPSGERIASLSHKMRNELEGWSAKGYRVQEARVNFIVAWRDSDDKENNEDTAVLLPELLLRRDVVG